MAASSDGSRDDRTRAAAPETYTPPPPGEPARDVGDAPPPPEIMIGEPLSQESQWALVWRQFRKRKAAVAAGAVILLLVSACVFAPLIANDRPIAYRGANRFAYEDAYRTVRVMLRQAPENLVRSRDLLAEADRRLDDFSGTASDDLTTTIAAIREDLAAVSAEIVPPPDPIDRIAATWHDAVLTAKLRGGREREARRIETLLNDASGAAGLYERAVDVLPRRFTGMASVVIGEQAEGLTAIGEQFAAALEDEVLSAVESETLLDEFRAHQPDDALFVSRWFAPAIRDLDQRGIGFLVLNSLMLVLLLAKAVWRRPWSKRMRQAALMATVGLPVLAGLAWWWFVPVELDATPYKNGVRITEASDPSDVPVLYESVLWPPVRYGFAETNLDRTFERPELLGISTGDRRTSWDGPHWLGTDKIGRDVLSRMLWGGRISLSVGLVAVSIYVAIGVVVGAIAGFFRGWADMVISRIIEVVIVFPTFFLILTIVAFVGPNLLNIMIVIGLTGWTGVARLVRGEFLRLTDQDFVAAGQALGYSPLRLIFRHILPNAMAPVLVAATFGIAGAILTESALSFLGLGITIPTPSWGGILAEGRATSVAPWLIYLPGLAIFITILCYNLAGEALRDASDPRLRGSR